MLAMAPRMMRLHGEFSMDQHGHVQVCGFCRRPIVAFTPTW